MQIDLFLELYKRVEFRKGDDIFSSKRVQNLTDEEVKELLGYTIGQVNITRIILNLYNNEGFNSLTEQLQNRIINLINKAKGPGQASYGSVVAGNEDVLKSLQTGDLRVDEMLELVRLVTTAEEKYQAQYGSEVACNKHVLRSNRHAVRSGQALKFVKFVVTSENDYKAQYESKVIDMAELIENGKVMIYLDGINQAKCLSEVEAIVAVAREESEKIKAGRIPVPQYISINFFESLVKRPDKTIRSISGDGLISEINSDTMVRVRK